VDVRVSKRFQLTEHTRFEASLDLFNLLNSNSILNQNAAVGSSTGPTVAPLSTSWGRPSLLLTPRIIRVGVKLSF